MLQKYLMAVDAGTGSVRAVLFDLEGHQIGCVQHEWEHKQDPRYPGSMDFDWSYNWKLTADCIKGVISETKIDPKSIEAVSTTCMREGIIIYDREGREIWACANVDARSNEEVTQLINMDPDLEKKLYMESGQSFALDALPRLLWIKNKMPEVYKNAHYVGMFNDWLIYKMTGILAVEPSNGSTTGMFDLQKRDWDPALAEKCGLRTDIFPRVLECGTVAGHVNKKASSVTGLAEGTTVVVGGGDAQLGCIGVNVVRPNEAAIFGGSFWQYEFNTASGKTDPNCKIRVNCHAVPGVWQYEALAFKPGLVMRWFRDGFCQLEKQEAEINKKDTYYLMDQEAKKIPAGSYGMMCAFSDVMNFMHWKHSSPTFTNFELDPQKFNRYTFYRAILENTAMVTKGNVSLVKEATGNEPKEVVFAGGASKSPVWCQILSDVLGLPVRTPVVKEATALGAAILAGYGVKIYGSIEEASKKLVKWDKTYKPNMENNKIYENIYGNWKKVYAAQMRLCDEGITNSMWRAPGV